MPESRNFKCGKCNKPYVMSWAKDNHEKICNKTAKTKGKK